jgi:ribosomal silencing factor RsfS
MKTIITKDTIELNIDTIQDSKDEDSIEINIQDISFGGDSMSIFINKKDVQILIDYLEQIKKA